MLIVFYRYQNTSQLGEKSLAIPSDGEDAVPQDLLNNASGRKKKGIKSKHVGYS